MKHVIALAFIIVAALLLIVFGPFVLIWSINTLFKSGIEYSFWTWLASLYIGLIIASLQHKK